MIDREHDLPLTRQAAVLKLSRSGLYYRPRPVAPADLAAMRRIDALPWTTHSRAVGCCAICCGARASRSAARAS
jgi:putative transposase